MLRPVDYEALGQATNLQDLKTVLQSHKSGYYHNFLANEPVITPRIIEEHCMNKSVEDFNDFRANANEALAKFLDFVTYDYMIQNAIKLTCASMSGRKAADVLVRCHPLGMFEGMEGLTSATSIDDIYDIVLIDSPIGQFYQGVNRNVYDDLSVEQIKCLLYKNWLEAFYVFCMEVGGTTWEVMKEILEFEADRFVITLTRNTQGFGFLKPEDRQELYPQVGNLVPNHPELATCERDEQLLAILAPHRELASVLSRAGGADDGASIEAKFKEQLIELHKGSLSKQFHFGVFYSYIKLKEIEVSNLLWISECIVQDAHNRIRNYSPIFSH
jgi:V-type H+-transporting ATPase subunit d